jgi:phage tail protein X
VQVSHGPCWVGEGMGTFITHITREGDRWDTLAWRYYGDATLYGPIIQTNPQIQIEAVFEAGLRIGVPLLTVNPAVQDSADLPPWDQT